MKKYISKNKVVKVFKWDGFEQTLHNNVPQNQLMNHFEYDNDSLFVNTPDGSKLCKIGYYVVNDSAKLGNYIIMSPTQLSGQYEELK